MCIGRMALLNQIVGIPTHTVTFERVDTMSHTSNENGTVFGTSRHQAVHNTIPMTIAPATTSRLEPTILGPFAAFFELALFATCTANAFTVSSAVNRIVVTLAPTPTAVQFDTPSLIAQSIWATTGVSMSTVPGSSRWASLAPSTSVAAKVRSSQLRQMRTV